MPFESDNSKWPVLYCAMKGEFTEGDVQQQIDFYNDALTRKQKHAVIIDSNEGRNMSSIERKRLADWIKEKTVELKEFRAITVIVTSSKLVRGALTAIYWVSPPPYPYKIVKTFNEAEEIVKGYL